MKLEVSVILLIFTVLVDKVHGADWSYSGNHGPSHWGDSYGNCSGSSQSPINIVTSSVHFTESLSSFQLTAYDSIPSGAVWTLSNNGHSAVITVTAGDYFMEKGGLPDSLRYKLAQFHFHWGSTDTTGSEHKMNGNYYPMEVHFVHYNDNYASLGDAMVKADGLAVLGFFFEISASANSDLDFVINSLSSISHSGDSASVTVANLDAFLPANRAKFYRYDGSLTTPGCYETVKWTLFEETIKISAVQMAKFRDLFSNAAGSTDVALEDNFRPVQSLNTRTVLSTNAQYKENSAISVTSSVACFLFSFLLLSWLH